MTNKLELDELELNESKLNEYYNSIFGRNIDKLSLKYYMKKKNYDPKHNWNNILEILYNSNEYIEKSKKVEALPSRFGVLARAEVLEMMQTGPPIIHHYDKNLSKGFVQKIYLLTQFYIDKKYQRQKEILFFLK